MQCKKTQGRQNLRRLRSRLRKAADFRTDAAETRPMCRAGRVLLRPIRATASALIGKCCRTPLRYPVHAAKPIDLNRANGSDTSPDRPSPRMPLGAQSQASLTAGAGQGGPVIRCRQRQLRYSAVGLVAMHAHIDRRLLESAKSVGKSVICAAHRSQVADLLRVCGPESFREVNVFAQPHSEHNHLLPRFRCVSRESVIDHQTCPRRDCLPRP